MLKNKTVCKYYETWNNNLNTEATNNIHQLKLDAHMDREEKKMELDTYIDKCLVSYYAQLSYNHQDEETCFELDVRTLPENEQATFIDKVLAADTGIREQVYNYMQYLVDAALVKQLDRYRDELRFERNFE